MSDKTKDVLLCYQQADEEGVLVIASRQSIHDAADKIEALEAENKRLRTFVEKLLDGGVWYASAIELDVYHDTLRMNGEDLEEEAKRLVGRAALEYKG